MHTSAGAACGRDDDGAPELFVCRSSQTMRVKETRLYVNKSIHHPNPSVRQQQPAHTVRILVCCRHEALPEPLGCGCPKRARMQSQSINHRATVFRGALQKG